MWAQGPPLEGHQVDDSQHPLLGGDASGRILQARLMVGIRDVCLMEGHWGEGWR